MFLIEGCINGDNCVKNLIARVNNIRREYLTPYRAVKYDCVHLNGFFSYNSVIP